MTQTEAVIQTIHKFGGVATLGQINSAIFEIDDCQWGTKTPFATIRRIVRHTPKHIYRIKPGLYGLVGNKSQLEKEGIIEETEHNKNSAEIIEFNHSYYQGILLTYGRLRGMQTFVPAQDKNKYFLHSKLSEVSTLKELPEFSYPYFLERSRTIDTIWFNERLMPNTFFEVEHSTDIQNSLLKFYDLRDFHARMIIVADGSRIHEYEKKIHYDAFRDLIQPQQRIEFLSYEELVKQYEAITQRTHFTTII